MPVRRLFVVVLLVLFTMGFELKDAHADTVDFSFAVNPVGCVYSGTCSDPTTGSGVFTVTPITWDSYTAFRCFSGSSTVYRITDVVGQLDGSAMSLGVDPSILGCGNNLMLDGTPLHVFGASLIYFTAGGQHWQIVRGDGPVPLGTNLVLSNMDNPQASIPITWSAQVFVPEPPTLAVVGIGLLILLFAKKRRTPNGVA